MDVVKMVVRKFIGEVNLKLAPRKVSLNFTESAVTWLATHGYQAAYGARPIRRLIEDRVKKPLADELLFGRLAKGGVVQVDTEDDELAFEFPKVEAHV
jgi:ATP-dependent Clp protease ATP-binding subunit ClpA